MFTDPTLLKHVQVAPSDLTLGDVILLYGHETAHISRAGDTAAEIRYEWKGREHQGLPPGKTGVAAHVTKLVAP